MQDNPNHRIAHSAPAGEVEPVAEVVSLRPLEGTAVVKWKPLLNGVPSLDVGTPLYTHPAPPADLVEFVTILHQYRSDMKHPPTPDSRERRVAMIDAAIAKFGRDA